MYGDVGILIKYIKNVHINSERYLKLMCDKFRLLAVCWNANLEEKTNGFQDIM